MKPPLSVLVLRLLVQETRMGQLQARSAPARGEFDSYNCLGALGSSRPCEPCQFDYPIRYKSEEPSVVWIALAFLINCLEEERSVDLRSHQQGTRRRKPAIELLRPGSKQHVWGCSHCALGC